MQDGLFGRRSLRQPGACHAPRQTHFRRRLPVERLVGYLVRAAGHAQNGTNAGANAEICASTGDAYSPEQRIAACGALIDALKDQPQTLAAALVNRGAALRYVNKMQLALGDFDRAIALDPNNARAFRERANTCRSIGRLDQALADANQAVRLDPNDAHSARRPRQRLQQ